MQRDKHWSKAMQDEYKASQQGGTWDQKHIHCEWS